jgi:small subunit ribosomal protein S33
MPPAANPIALASRQLAQLRSRIFNTTYNPTGARTGAKYLRQRLVGPAMLGYYKPQLQLKSIMNALPANQRGFEYQKGLSGEEADRIVLMDPVEVQRLKDVERKKLLGKGPPKKGEGEPLQIFIGKVQ